MRSLRRMSSSQTTASRCSREPSFPTSVLRSPTMPSRKRSLPCRRAAHRRDHGWLAGRGPGAAASSSGGSLKATARDPELLFRPIRHGARERSQGQRVSGQHLDFAVDRRARHGPSERRRHCVWRRRRCGDLPVAVDLGDQPHRLFQVVLGALILLLVVLPKGLVGQFEAWRSARRPSRLLGESS